MQAIAGALAVAVAPSEEATARKLRQAVEEFHTSIAHTANGMPTSGERSRHGARLSTGCVASTVPPVLSPRLGQKPQRR
jgi:hypothetical protein